MNKAIAPLFLLLAPLLFLAYSNTFYTSWHLDDEPNILTNSKLHISKLTFQQLSTALRAHPTVPNKIYRPLPCLTFGLNWYIGQDNVFGYHVVNLAVHILTAWFLFLTLHLLLRIHYKKQYSPQFFTAAALLGALFWALAPIQTQSVTYIVQRMASMAALFSIIAIYTYLRGKIAAKKKYAWFSLSLLSFCAALGSKENTALLPLSFLLIEFSFFRHQLFPKKTVVLAVTGGFALLLGFLFVRNGLDISLIRITNSLSFLDGYDKRPFSLNERILTEPRIILMYLSQIFFPIAERLSIEHDIVLSTSLFSPWTTLPAIITILLLICVPLFFLKKYPIVCFPVLFFFLSHTVESTIVPLELIFEHRNYLPSLFLFLPGGVLVAHILYSNPPQTVFRRTTAMLCTTLFLIILGHATYVRNQAWATEESLWADALRKAPNSTRAASYLGKQHLRAGQYRSAYRYFQSALMNTEKSANPKFMKEVALNDLGAVQYSSGRYKQALQYFNQCLESDNKDESCLKNRTLNFLRLNLPEKALSDALTLIREYPMSAAYQYLAALSAYRAGDRETALKWMQKIVNPSLSNHEGMYLLGILLIKSGAYENSLFFLQRAAKLSPNTIKYHLALAAAYHAGSQTSSAQETIHELLKKHPLPSIKNALKTARKYKELDKKAADFIDSIIASSLNPNTLLLQVNAI